MKPSRWKGNALLSLSATSMVLAAEGPPGLESPPRSPEQALASFSVDEGFAVELVASEPLTCDPVAIDWGFDGRLWVAEMADYPYGMDGEGKPGGRVRILRDTDGDGRMDKSTLFLDGLSFPTGVMAWKAGALITAAPHLLYAEDTDGDDKADHRQVLFSGFMEGNQQLRFNGLRWGLDNWVHCASGGHHTGFGAGNRITVLHTGEQVALGSGDLRFRPGRHALERLAGPSQFGRVRDDWGNWFGVQNSYPLWHYVLEERYLKRSPQVTTPDPRKQLRGRQPRVFGAKASQRRFHGFDHVGRYTSACGPSIYRDDWLFPCRPGLTHAFTCEPFSNLVQHHHLKPSGVSFEGKRAESSSVTDFLASTDRWCRPVVTRTGPDGALWVVDMYRYMIEHPDWLPENGREELKPFYRHGEDRGRIYRLVVKDKPGKAIPSLRGKGEVELIAYLADSNGPVRDAAQRMLVTGSGGAELPRLREMARRHNRPRARLQALAVLSDLGLDAATTGSALGDSHEAIRRFVVPYASEGEVIRLADDPSAAVRLQVALVLGKFESEASAIALLGMAKRSNLDHYTQAAIVSSLGNHFGAFVRSSGYCYDQEWLLKALFSMAPAHPDLVPTLLRNVFSPRTPKPTAFRLAAHWLGVSKRAPSNHLAAIVEEARQVAGRESAAAELRAQAVQLLGRSPGSWKEEQRILESCLHPRVAIEVQRAAVDVLRRSRRAEALRILLGRWPGLSPGVRLAVIDALLEHRPWITPLLDRLERGVLKAQDLTVTQRRRLLEREPGAAKWLQSPARREEALKARAGSLALAGDAGAGAKHFAQYCALCHQVGEMGKPIGPDLRALTNRDPRAVYAAILDPNRAVEPRYVAYTVTTTSGETVYGMLVRETANAFTLQQLDGSERQLLRAELKSLESNQTSLMPEGLEMGLSDQALADLIAFVQAIR